MKGIAAMIVAFWLALPQARNQQIHTDKDSLTLASVRLPSSVRKNIERVIFDFVTIPADQRGAIAGQIQLDRVRLGPQGRWVWQAVAPIDFCGSHAKCEYWLFDPTTGASLVDDALGAELDVLDTRHKGWLDFTTSGNISSCESVTVYYQFDGHKYRSMHADHDTSTCDLNGP